MGDFLREQYGENPVLTKENKFEKVVSFICAALFITALVLWTIKGWQYLDAKTRDVSLNADYTEQMLRSYRD